MTIPAETRAPSPKPEMGLTEPGGLPGMGTEGLRERQATLRWVLALGTLGASLAAAFNLVFFLDGGAWQFLAVAGGMALALACLLVAALLGRRQRIDAAGAWVLWGLVLALVVAELFHRGVTLYLVPGGTLLILITGTCVLPRRLPLLALLTATYAGYAWLVNQWETWLPFQRYDMRQLGDSGDAFAVFIVGFLLLGGGWGMVRSYRRIVAIRTRLAASFVLVVLLTAAIILAAAIAIVYQNGREQVVTQLAAIARIKEVEIERWVASIEGDLGLVLQDSQVMPRVLVLLQNPAMGEAQEYFTRAYLEQVVSRTERLETLLLLDAQGRVILSTRVEEKGGNRGAELYFQGGLDGFTLQPPVYAPGAGSTEGSDGEVAIMAARPIVDAEGETVGVLAGKVRASSLAEILGRQSWIGDTGEIYLVDRNGVLLTALRFSPLLPAGYAEPADEEHFVLDTEAARLAIARREGGSVLYADYRGEMALGVYRWLPALQTGLVAKQDRQEALGLGTLLILVVGLAGLIAVVLAIGISLVVTRTITGPLAELTARSSRIASGDMSSISGVDGVPEWWTRDRQGSAPSRTVPHRPAPSRCDGVGNATASGMRRRRECDGVGSTSRDEVATLARAFDSMGRQVRELIETLEARVAERTRELERRSKTLEASAAVSRAASSILNPDELVREVVGLVGREFDLESTELYLLDEGGEWAVLQAGASRGGQGMPGRDFRVQVGEGTVGRAILNARWEISLHATPGGPGSAPSLGEGTEEGQPGKVGITVERAAEAGEQGIGGKTPDQPLEAALPLRSRGQVLGAIAVRAGGREALNEDTMTVLQTMADQVAVALDNARLFVASRRAMEAERRAHGEIDRQAWAAMIGARPVRGYRCDAGGVLPLLQGPASGQTQQVTVEDDRGGQTVSVPLLLREETIGGLRFHKDGSDAHWTADELALLARLAEELGQALESVRLYQDVQRGAARDRLIARVTGRMRESLQVDAVLQSAVQEMRRALFLSEVEVRIGKVSVSTDEGWPGNHLVGGDGNATQD